MSAGISSSGEENKSGFSIDIGKGAVLTPSMHKSSSDPAFYGIPLKYISLVLLMAQNTALVLTMRYSRTRDGPLFLSTTAVVMAEMLKTLSCLVVIFVQEGFSFRMLLNNLNENILKQPTDCLKISVPSIIYTIQNNLLFVAVSNLEAATFQVTYQLKILTTAVFSVLMLAKPLSRLQWLSLIILFAGVSIVQVQSTSPSKSTTSEHTQSPFIGLVAVCISCVMSGFAGVYFEKILKGSHQTIWLRNVQLGVLGVVIGYATVQINDGEAVASNGFFYGYDVVVWLVIALQSLGGLMVAVVVKYADNILKGFATSGAIVFSCVLSIFIFDFVLTLQFCIGAALVISSVYMYGKYPFIQPSNSLPKPKVNGSDTEKV